MGLTIKYQLSLDGSLSVKEVKAKLNSLRQACLDLPFQEVGPMWDVKGEQCNYEQYRGKEDDLFWCLIQSNGYVKYRVEWDCLLTGPDVDGVGTHHREVTPKRVIAFMAYPGKGCESANVGMRLMPKRQAVEWEDFRGNKHTTNIKVPGGQKWTWSSFCKTLYATQVSGEHFVHCHLTVIRMLDRAKELGFDVQVQDEGDYWEKRDIPHLLEEANLSAAGIAAVLGALKDQGHNVESPITKQKDFEHLEAKGQEQPQVKEIVNGINALLVKPKPSR